MHQAEIAPAHRRRASWGGERVVGGWVLARTISPEVPLSRRCTMPGRRGPPTPAIPAHARARRRPACRRAARRRDVSPCPPACPPRARASSSKTTRSATASGRSPPGAAEAPPPPPVPRLAAGRGLARAGRPPDAARLDQRLHAACARQIDKSCRPASDRAGRRPGRAARPVAASSARSRACHGRRAAQAAGVDQHAKGEEDHATVMAESATLKAGQ